LADVVGAIRGVLRSTPRRTFAIYPLLAIGDETLRQRRLRLPHPEYLPLLAWGYLQYYLAGKYRERKRAGPRGFASAPDRLLRTGPYAYTRNPMYLGHLIFLSGLALGLRSYLAWFMFLLNLPWFHRRVLQDEIRLRARFGAEYDDYCRHVRRWIPVVA